MFLSSLILTIARIILLSLGEFGYKLIIGQGPPNAMVATERNYVYMQDKGKMRIIQSAPMPV